MKIVIDHDNCQHGGAFSDRCLSATILNPLGHERYCTAQVTDDGLPEMTVVLIMDAKEYTLVLRDEEERKAVAFEGWTAFVKPSETVS
jgi:hypothetical protein